MFVLYPDTCPIGRFNTEHIISLRQIGIRSRTLFTYIVPLFVEALEYIRILHIFRKTHIQCCKRECHGILLVRKHQMRQAVQRLRQDGTGLRNNYLIGNLQTGKDNLGHISIFPDLIGPKRQQSSVRSKQQASVARSYCRTFLEKQFLTNFQLQEIVEMTICLIHPAQSAFRTHPNISVLVFGKRE